MRPKQPHEIGSPLLPASSPQIRVPLEFGTRVLRVVPDVPNDTHHLLCDEQRVASHPNGFSCHVLATRLIAGDPEHVKAQAEYIAACGGQIHLDPTNLLEPTPPS